MRHRPDRQDGSAGAAAGPAELGLDGIVTDHQELTGNRVALGITAGCLGHKRRPSIPDADDPAVGPDPGAVGAFASHLGLQEGDEVHEPVIITRIGDPVRTVVVKLGPDGVGPRPAGHRIKQRDQHLPHAVLGVGPGTIRPPGDRHALAAIGHVGSGLIVLVGGEDDPIEIDAVVGEFLVIGFQGVGPPRGGRGPEEDVVELLDGVIDRRVAVGNRDHGDGVAPRDRRAHHLKGLDGERASQDHLGAAIESLDVTRAEHGLALLTDLRGAPAPGAVRVKIHTGRLHHAPDSVTRLGHDRTRPEPKGQDQGRDSGGDNAHSASQLRGPWHHVQKQGDAPRAGACTR